MTKHSSLTLTEITGRNQLVEWFENGIPLIKHCISAPIGWRDGLTFHKFESGKQREQNIAFQTPGRAASQTPTPTYKGVQSGRVVSRPGDAGCSRSARLVVVPRQICVVSKFPIKAFVSMPRESAVETRKDSPWFDQMSYHEYDSKNNA